MYGAVYLGKGSNSVFSRLDSFSYYMLLFERGVNLLLFFESRVKARKNRLPARRRLDSLYRNKLLLSGLTVRNHILRAYPQGQKTLRLIRRVFLPL
jgi:hypothetical protein